MIPSPSIPHQTSLLRILLATVVAIALTGTLGNCGGARELTILHTNDTHSQIYPLPVNLADTAKAGRGGFLRRIAMIKEERAKNPTCCSSTVATSRRAAPTTPSSRAMSRQD